jgi:pilus assembly protein Flp/PilA
LFSLPSIAVILRTGPLPEILEIPMKRLNTAVQKFVKSDEGIAVTEYGLLIALVAVLLIGVVTIFGSSISSWFEAKSNKITSF